MRRAYRRPFIRVLPACSLVARAEWVETLIADRAKTRRASTNGRFHPWTRSFSRARLKPWPKLTILSHPVTPVAPAELEEWLDLQLNHLRSSAPMIVRLSRLTQALPSIEVGGGWLIEVELHRRVASPRP